jgi:MFS family permease
MTADHVAENRTAAAARLSLGLLLSINLLNYIDRYVLAALEPNIAATFFAGRADDAATLAKMGSLATAFLFSYMFAAPLLGWLADRMSRWILIGISVGIWSLATGGSGWASTFLVLLIMRCFVGIGEAGYGPAAPTIISDLFPVKKRGAVLAWFFMAIPVGSALGYEVGSAIGGRFGWRTAFFVVTPPGLLLAAMALFMTEPRQILQRATTKLPRGDSKKQEYLALLRNRSFVLDTIGMTAMTFAMGGMSFWMPRYLCGDRASGCRGLPTSAKMIFGGILAACGLAATLLGGIAGDRLRARFSGSYFLVSALGMFAACPFLVIFLYMPFPWAWAPLAVCIFFLFFNTGPSNTILANVTHPAIRATAFAVNIFVIHALGDATAPPLLGGIAGRFGWNAAFGLVCAMMALAGVLWLIGMPHLARDTDVVEREVAGGTV